jgi:ribosomal protein S12 methylthiotransferase accessory factor
MPIRSTPLRSGPLRTDLTEILLTAVRQFVPGPICGRIMTLESRMTAPHARPMFLEIDLDSEQGRALQKSVGDRYGPRITEAARLASRIFLLRSPWAPGLRFVGAETKERVLGDDGTTRVPISLSGSGEDLEEAFVCCVGEGVDRLAQIELPGDIALIASLADMGGRLWPPAAEVIKEVATTRVIRDDTPLAWVAGKRFDRIQGPQDDFGTLLPADWCLRRLRDQTHLSALAPLSVGVAAGPTFEWAASRAVLELIERDAASLWWIGGRRGRGIPLDHPGLSDIAKLLATLRQQADDRVSWLLDITSDIGIPVVVALSCNRDGRQLAYGLASRPSIKQAMHAALLELCQTELAILIAMIKRMEAGEDELNATDRSHLQRSSFDASQCELLHPVDVRLESRELEAEAGFSTILGVLHDIGIDVALVEQTRPEFGIPVVRAVAPALQLMPSTFMTDRLRQQIAMSGGGSRYTGGIPLIE